MKRCLLLTCLLMLALTSVAQIYVTDKKSRLAEFKGTTTVFVLFPADRARMAQFRQVIGETWTVTPFIITTADSTDFVDKTRHSVFAFKEYPGSPTIDVRRDEFYLGTLKERRKNGEFVFDEHIAGIVLSMDRSFVSQPEKTSGSFQSSSRRKEYQEMEQMLMKHTVPANWGPGFLRAYLRFINAALLSGDDHGHQEPIRGTGMSAVFRDTLYIPQILKSVFGSAAGKAGEESAVLKAYPYPWRFISHNELNDMIMAAQKPVYYVHYTTGIPDKFVLVAEGREGKILYSQHRQLSTNIRSRDLAEVIEKMLEEFREAGR